MRMFELRELLVNSTRRSLELEAKYRSGQEMTRRDCDEMRHCTQRIGVVAKELWLRSGEPEGFPDLEQPIKLTPLPQSMRPLDLSEQKERGVN